MCKVVNNMRRGPTMPIYFEGSMIGAGLSRSATQMNRKKSSAQEKIASKQNAKFEEEELHEAG